MDNKWDWLKMIPSWDWHKLVLAGWPGWVVDNALGEPNFATLEIVKGTDKSSRDIAIEWDDLSEGQFYYRDYTKSSLPFIDEGEMYKSIFCFQYLRDAVKFCEVYGAKLNQRLTLFA